MLGDALVYGFSLYVVSRHEKWKAAAAMAKGLIMAFFDVLVLAEGGYQLLYPSLPQFEMIGFVGLLALMANAACFSLLWHHRTDFHMRSVWLCSRNDILANVFVLLAAIGVWLSHSQWSDLLVGLGIALIFLRFAFQVIGEAWRSPA